LKFNFRVKNVTIFICYERKSKLVKEGKSKVLICLSIFLYSALPSLFLPSTQDEDSSAHSQSVIDLCLEGQTECLLNLIRRYPHLATYTDEVGTRRRREYARSIYRGVINSFHACKQKECYVE